MKTELNLEPIREYLYNSTYDKGYHISELATIFRKMAIEFSLLTLEKIDKDGFCDKKTDSYLYTLGTLADALDKTEKENN